MRVSKILIFLVIPCGCASFEAGYVSGWNAVASFEEAVFGKALVEKMEMSPEARAWLEGEGWAFGETPKAPEKPVRTAAKADPKPVAKRSTEPSSTTAKPEKKVQDFDDLTPAQQEEVKRFFDEIERKQQRRLASRA